MGITKVPVEPYWVNATNWWVEKNLGSAARQATKEEVADYDNWMLEQGACVIRTGEYNPWLEFNDELLATKFMLMWA